jgi:hypothetical protein
VLALVKEEALRATFHGDPKKRWRGPKSFIVNSGCREVIMHWRRTRLDTRTGLEVDGVVIVPRDKQGRVRLDLDEAKGD